MPLRQRGFTLLEVMIAVFVLAIGLLGMAHLQITSLKHNQSAEFRTQSAMMAADMLDRMRANRDAAQNGNYAIAIGDEPPSSTNTIADADIVEWLENLSFYLPQGNGQIACGVFNVNSEFVCDITINWRETLNDGDDYGELGTSTFTLSGAI
ncbi:type IV pilus modification protein PilV [Methylophaga sp.]|uniref:type IV pilus modification protein PilV n=1 Tax=Methylophaga sp. TaxID=2024840 RepID=UPI00271EC579|nr:type IV pilus modification protein PilV [Methylophaga sp.]MDO8825286.1 type IV pilus modification protein PilV [Methylophaga sp.]